MGRFSQLSPDRQGRVRQLKKDNKLVKALLELLPFAGLWADYEPGALNRELPMRCREVSISDLHTQRTRAKDSQELYCYLRSIHRRWTHILGPDVDPHCLDLQTVRLFHVLMPAHSIHDSRTICASMQNFKAFAHVRNPTIRQGIQNRLLSCERIPTFKSFHRDTILLEGCHQPLRDFFLMEETTLQKACDASFSLSARYFRTNYIDMWLQIMRNYPYLSDHSSANVKKNGNEGEPLHYLKSKAQSSKLVSFVASRGFWTCDIENLLPQDHDQMASNPALDLAIVRAPLCKQSLGVLCTNMSRSSGHVPRPSRSPRLWSRRPGRVP